MPNPVVHFEILAKDGPQLRDFYQGVFDWKLDVVPEMDYGLLGAQGDRGIGGGIGQSQTGGPVVTVYVEVDSIDAYLKQIEARGGKTVVPRTVIPQMVVFAQFADPQGNVVGLVEPGTPG
jgi:predicted enzyme related to lactoylglutathione lyase